MSLSTSTPLDGHGLSIEVLHGIACGRRPCHIADEARPRIRKSRHFVEVIASQQRAVYGINTGFGPLSGFRVNDLDQATHQLMLLHHLSVGQGPLFEAEETRAIMVARANALVRGYSGIRESVLELLVAVVNKGILPEIPSQGSVGASGDLVPLAHMANLLVGTGYARRGQGRLKALEALAEAGLAPIQLQCKEGLALVNGTSAMTGLSALSVWESERILRWMEFLTACQFQVMQAEPEVLCEQIHAARGFRGQMCVARGIAAHLTGNPDYKKRIDEHQWGSQPKTMEGGVEIQDPYSLRCSPQIMGAVQESLWHVAQVVTRELNASTDNPLVFPESEMVIHGGNFYGQQIGMVNDYLRIGLIKLALLIDRQLERLVNASYNKGLPPMLTGSDPGLNSGFAGAQLLATSLAAEARLLAMPASIQSIPTNANNQDLVSMGCHAARMTRATLPLLWKLVAIQGLALVQAVDLRGDGATISPGYALLRERIREISPRLVQDRPLQEDIEKVCDLFKSEEFQGQLLSPYSLHENT